MASQTILKGLKRITKSVPLSTLNQGASLSIRSDIPLASLCIIPQWRDDGHINLQHKFEANHQDDLCLFVSRMKDRMTSLGRPAAHVALDIRKKSPSLVADDNEAGSTEVHQISSIEKKNFAEDIIFSEGDVVTRTDEIDSEDRRQEAGVYLSVLVPEKVNLDVKLQQGGDISVPGKIEGDVELFTSDGAIRVKKLRGHQVHLESFGKNALVHAQDVLEAQQLTIKSSGRLRAKQLHGSSIDVRISHTESSKSDFVPIESDDEAALVDVSSLYVSGQGGATLSVQSAEPQRKAVRVKTNHGPIRVNVDGTHQPTSIDPNTKQIHPLVELGGVNGNFELLTENTVADSSLDWKSCLVHIDSLSPDTVSLLSSDKGDISLTVDRKVESDVRLLTTSTKDCLEAAGALLAEEEDSELALDVIRNLPPSPPESTTPGGEPKIEIATKAFTAHSEAQYRTSHIEYVEGWIENNSAEPPSRFDRKVRGETAMGKINADSAADQALRGFGDSIDDEEEFPRPLLAAVGTGTIKVETVSWLGAIARRYGLDEEGRDLGRQATRRGRPLQPLSPKNE